MFPLSLHRVKANAALNRRTLEEQFQFWAEQYNELGDYSFALRTLYRTRLKLDSCQEIWSNRTIHHDTEKHRLYANPAYSTSRLDIHSAPGGDFWLDWNCDLIAEDAFAALQIGWFGIRIIPFVSGQLLWAAADKLMHEWPLVNHAGDWLPEDQLETSQIPGAYHSVSGQAHFTSPTSTFEVGLVAATFTESHFFGLPVDPWINSHLTGENPNVVVRRAY